MSWETWRQALADSVLVQWEFNGNSLLQWLIAAGLSVGALFVLRLAKAIVHRRAKAIAERRSSGVAQGVAEVATATKLWFLLIISLFLGSQVLHFPDQKTTKFVEHVAVAGLLVQIAVWANVLIALGISRYMRRRMETDAASVTMMAAVGFFGRLGVWALTLLLILANLDIDVSALVAGLGVGGIAVALAAQNVLGDLFASLSIVLDRPFILGDFIAIGDFLGSVEHIGLKTTRLRSLSGEQLVFSNADLLQSRIRNYKRMYERRILFTIGVTYDTPHDKLTAIPGMIREAIAAHEKTRFDRAHFKSYGDFALIFETVYYVLSPDYNLYMDIQQAINLTLFEQFAAAGIEFAFPTQTLYLHKADGAAGS